MKRHFAPLWAAWILLLTLPIAQAASPLARLAISRGGPLDFDDMGYAPALLQVLVPAAQSGALAWIDPETMTVSRWQGVASSGLHNASGETGTTSADTGDGLVFIADRGRHALIALDPTSHAPVATASLDAGPDYVRFVAPLEQVWVTEPGAEQIERFALTPGPHRMLRRLGRLKVPGGPESLVIDAADGLAYTNLWKDRTLQITLQQPRISASWANRCQGSRGLAWAPQRQVLFVGCKEGKVVALDPLHEGHIIATAAVGAGVDIIAWNPHLAHLYAPGAKSGTLSVVLLQNNRRLKVIDSVQVARHSHCVASDGGMHAYVCDPGDGAVLVYTDHAGP